MTTTTDTSEGSKNPEYEVPGSGYGVLSTFVREYGVRTVGTEKSLSPEAPMGFGSVALWLFGGTVPFKIALTNKPAGQWRVGIVGLPGPGGSICTEYRVPDLEEVRLSRRLAPEGSTNPLLAATLRGRRGTRGTAGT